MNNIVTIDEKNRIDSLCAKYEIKNYKINNDGSINANQSVYFGSLKGFNVLPLIFNVVYGDFNCENGSLTTLIGAPTIVTGNFLCAKNILTSLNGAPVKVGGTFSCGDNKLSSLEYSPKEVGMHFNCSENDLTSLEGAPEKINGSFMCHWNLLTTLHGAPKEVGIEFSCSNNKITTLDGAPVFVGSNFHCYGNYIKTLEHCPIIRKILYADNNELPKLLVIFLKTASDEDIRTFIKYQNDFDVWTPIFNKEGFDDLLADIKEGLE